MARHVAPLSKLGLAALVHAVLVTGAVAQPGSGLRILDVPFIEQSEALCGGAAAAMVMRYWGARGVYAESFAPLVEASAGGIRGERLLAELSRRGWVARSFRGDAQMVQARLTIGQPVVALIEDRPGAYHYVVLVAWTADRVIYHDPAKSPFQVVGTASFERAWQASAHWTMLLLPGDAAAVEDEPAAPAKGGTSDSSAVSPCHGLIEAGTRSAEQGAHGAALVAFAAAADLCPEMSEPHRETAGVHALDGRWPEAVHHARAAIARNDDDVHAWRILATAAYIGGDPEAALEAWNRVGEPELDLLSIEGLGRTRYGAVTRLIDLKPGDILQTSSLQAAEKRLTELPSAELGRIRYTPLGEGRAEVSAVVFERPPLPTTRASLVRVGFHALTDRELRLDFASPTGGGDAISAAWRWWPDRPRLELAYSAPSRLGIWRASIQRDEQTYAAASSTVVETRLGGGLSLANWTPWLLRWEVGLDLDSWSDRGRTTTLRAAADQRRWSDRVSVTGGVDVLTGAFRASRASAGLSVRNRTRHEGTVLLGGGGLELASTDAPLALWPGAGSDPARRVLLRGHPLLDDGRVSGEVFGRRVAHASVEARRWMGPVFRVLRVAPAVFVDAARAEKRLNPGPAWHVDAGVGLRVAVPGTGVLRIDLGKGLRDGSTAVSAAFVR